MYTERDEHITIKIVEFMILRLMHPKFEEKRQTAIIQGSEEEIAQ